MVAKVIQGNYDCLQAAAKVFAHHADLSVALTFQLEMLVDQLQGGGWRGMGAEAFYVEMRDLIFPAMRTLEDSLQFAGEGALRIVGIMEAAEEEAAALFRGLPGGEVTPPRQDDKERRKRLIEMLLGTLRLSGLLNSPLPEPLESLTVAELEALLDGNENAERSWVALGKLVLWVLDSVQASELQTAFWDLSANQRYEFLTALMRLMESLSQGTIPDTTLLTALSDPVRRLMLTTWLNVVQRFRLAQTDERVKTDIEYQHEVSEIGGAAFADWIGNLNLFWGIGSRLYSPKGGSGGGGKDDLRIGKWGPTKPSAQDPKLQRQINQLWREEGAIGNGGTGDAIRHTLETGDLVGGSNHLQKGIDARRFLKKWLKAAKNNHYDPPTPQDIRIAEEILEDLQDALNKAGIP